MQGGTCVGMGQAGGIVPMLTVWPSGRGKCWPFLAPRSATPWGGEWYV